MSDEPLQPPEDEQETTVKRLTGPRDSLPDDPVAQVADPDFPPALRGYDRATVDQYVERVVRLVAELHSTRSPRAAVRVALERVGEETSDILSRAHETADQVTADARREADELTGRTRRETAELAERTRVEAEQRLADAEREVKGMIAEAQQRAQDLDRDADEIWQERGRLLDDVRRIADELLGVTKDADRRYPPGEAEEPGAATAAGEEPYDLESAGTEPDATVEIPATELPDALAESPEGLPGPEHPGVPPAEPEPGSEYEPFIEEGIVRGAEPMAVEPVAEEPAAEEPVAEDEQTTDEWVPPSQEPPPAEPPRWREP
jgi:cell division septum initiation protein DivIVA